mmetsp:Transcript_638/g.924  ORF Transcript_638/g.924 Transcript_638/m.924 type:complete len:230 (+) Transcript_638:1-690(+)
MNPERKDSSNADDAKTSLGRKIRKKASSISIIKAKNTALCPSRCRCVFGIWAMMCMNPERRGLYLPEIQWLIVTVGNAGDFITNALTVSSNAPGVRFAALEALCALASNNQETSPILASLLVPHVLQCLRSTRDQTIAYEGLRALHLLLEAWPRSMCMMEKDEKTGGGSEPSSSLSSSSEHLSSMVSSLITRFAFDVDIVSLCMRIQAIVQATTAADAQLNENADSIFE